MPPRQISSSPRGPVKMTTIVENLPTQDSIPASTTWFSSSVHPERPKASIQIYDVSSSTPSQEQTSFLATKLLNDRGSGIFTRKDRVDYWDRLDIYVLAISSDLSDEEKVEICIRHQEVEIAVRNRAEGKEWFIQQWESIRDYRRFFVVIDKKEDKWEEEGMLFVWWDMVEREREEDELVPAVKVTRVMGLQFEDRGEDPEEEK